MCNYCVNSSGLEFLVDFVNIILIIIIVLLDVLELKAFPLRKSENIVIY